MRLTETPRKWTTPEAVHIDVRGLDPPGPMVAILRLIDSGEVDAVIIAHLDREPVFLYPELHERGWTHEILPSAGDTPSCEGEVTLRMVRLPA